MRGTVWFVGAGPGDPELLTVKGRALIERAGAILFAGSLVNEAATRWAPPGCVIADSKEMTLPQMAAWLIEQADAHETVVRLQTGDPALDGAQEARLEVEPERVDLIEEDGPAVGELKLTNLSLVRTGEGTLLVSEEF